MQRPLEAILTLRSNIEYRGYEPLVKNPNCSPDEHINLYLQPLNVNRRFFGPQTIRICIDLE